MSNDIQKEYNKYLVVKWDYLLGFLTHEQVRDLTTILNAADEERKRRGFPDNKYIVCNQDEPYAEKIWQMILDGEREKQAKNELALTSKALQLVCEELACDDSCPRDMEIDFEDFPECASCRANIDIGPAELHQQPDRDTACWVRYFMRRAEEAE